MTIRARHVFPVQELHGKMSALICFMNGLAGWRDYFALNTLQMGSLEDLVNTEQLFISLFFKNLPLIRTSLFLVSMPFDLVGLPARPPASGYGAILKGAAAHTHTHTHTPGPPAASLVCLTFCQHHVNEGPVSVHRPHTGAPFNEFAI